ncbi:uncharacterized protein LOC117583194 [Drosophila guanche]|uniref:uncharacterized protein LOC117583194 n=1 Tax=Drosophila guanche TaxID=7266 RepID=UPI001471B675|nr:uncharacterized protein LOC117583194 [Drosophila guanche]
MAHKMSPLVRIVVILHLIMEIHSRFEFTNVNCTLVNKKFGEFDYCYLKSVNRTYKYMSIKLKVYELPIRAMQINMELSKRFNGYKPFLYNITFDACKFFVNPNSSPVAKFFYESFMTYSSVNHSCPYNITTKFEFTNVNGT